MPVAWSDSNEVLKFRTGFQITNEVLPTLEPKERLNFNDLLFDFFEHSCDRMDNFLLGWLSLADAWRGSFFLAGGGCFFRQASAVAWSGLFGGFERKSRLMRLNFRFFVSCSCSGLTSKIITINSEFRIGLIRILQQICFPVSKREKKLVNFSNSRRCKPWTQKRIHQNSPTTWF